MSFWSSVLKRRQHLRHTFDMRRDFEALEESCLPSYAHGNPLSALVAWSRLGQAVRFFHQVGDPKPVLDFGSSSGELFHALGMRGVDYHFVEANERLAKVLKKDIPAATEWKLDQLPENHFGIVFAMDSLEHNEDVEALVKPLIKSMRGDGVFVLSGPTENGLYKLGRKLSGFHGHYHHTNIYAIEKVLAKHLILDRKVFMPYGIPLFSISAWCRKR